MYKLGYAIYIAYILQTLQGIPALIRKKLLSKARDISSTAATEFFAAIRAMRLQCRCDRGGNKPAGISSKAQTRRSPLQESFISVWRPLRESVSGRKRAWSTERLLARML